MCIITKGSYVTAGISLASCTTSSWVTTEMPLSRNSARVMWFCGYRHLAQPQKCLFSQFSEGIAVVPGIRTLPNYHPEKVSRRWYEWTVV